MAFQCLKLIKKFQTINYGCEELLAEMAQELMCLLNTYEDLSCSAGPLPHIGSKDPHTKSKHSALHL